MVRIVVESSASEVKSGSELRKLKVEEHSEVYYPKVFVADSVVNKSADTLGTAAKEAGAMVAEKTKKPASRTAGLQTVKSTTAGKVRRHRKRGVRVWISRIGALAVAMIAVLAVTLVGLRLAGFRTFTVMSGSMEPEYPVGAVIYVRPVDYQSLQVGDVISYVANEDNTVVTHRIAEIKIDEDDGGVWRFRTKGDANTVADTNLVHYKNVLGVPVITVPLIGWLTHSIQQPPGIYIALVVGTLLLAWTFLPDTLEERRKMAKKGVV